MNGRTLGKDVNVNQMKIYRTELRSLKSLKRNYVFGHHTEGKH
jgi:hypothetical protein